MLVLWTNWSHSGILDNDDFSTRAIMFRLKCFYFARCWSGSYFDDFFDFPNIFIFLHRSITQKLCTQQRMRWALHRCLTLLIYRNKKITVVFPPALQIQIAIISLKRPYNCTHNTVISTAGSK